MTVSGQSKGSPDLAPPLVVVVAAFDLDGTGGGATRAKQLAALFVRAGCTVRLMGFGEEGADREPEKDSEAPHAVECVPDHVGRLMRRILGAIGQEGGFAARSALVAAAQRAVAGARRGPCFVLLYNQDPFLAVRLARVCAEAGAHFLQQYAELHVAADYRARWLQGYYLRERLHFQAVPRWAAGNLVISSTLRELAARRGARNIFVLPSFVDAAAWERAIAGAGRNKIPGRVLYAGEGARRDCLGMIIAAAGHCRRRGLDITLRLVGLTPRRARECHALAAVAGLGEAMTIAGRIGHAELAVEYAEAAAAVLLRSDDRSSRACFPTRLGELLLAGPVLLSDIPDYNLRFAHGVNAYLADPNRVESVAEELAALVVSGERNDRVAAAGRDLARTVLNIGHYAADARRWLETVARTQGAALAAP
ncbi:MAG: glycosyltransferase [Opitutaceae bacterium]|nr:glycosyltransferase [Opitutaceae bacterium]